MAELKTKKNRKSAATFIATVPDPERRTDAKKLLTIFKKATGKRPVMWGTSIIGYGEYHYESARSAQKGDWPMTGFSPRKQSLTVYIMPGFKKLRPLLKKLGKHTVSGGSCIYIKRLSDVDTTVLTKIIKVGYEEMKRRYPTIKK